MSYFYNMIFYEKVLARGYDELTERTIRVIGAWRKSFRLEMIKIIGGYYEQPRNRSKVMEFM